jgi:AraC-like DNA-binding protein
MLVEISADPARDQSASHWPRIEARPQFESGAEAPASLRGTSSWFHDPLVAFELANVDIVFSVKARRAGTDRRPEKRSQALGATHGNASDNTIIEKLKHAISEAERSCEQHGALCAKMLRLALATHRLRVSSETDTVSRKVAPLSKWRLKRTMQHIDAHLTEPISLPDLAKVAGLSAMYFAAQFRVATGLRPHEFILRRRIDKAKDLLSDERNSLADVALSVGFQTQSHFTTVFKRFAGATPSQWRSLQRTAA